MEELMKQMMAELKEFRSDVKKSLLVLKNDSTKWMKSLSKSINASIKQ